MLHNIEIRAMTFGNFIVKNMATIRMTATHFGVSKSTVHNDVHNRLKSIDMDLYRRVKMVLDYNISVRHIRGGEATRRKLLHDSDSVARLGNTYN